MQYNNSPINSTMVGELTDVTSFTVADLGKLSIWVEFPTAAMSFSTNTVYSSTLWDQNIPWGEKSCGEQACGEMPGYPTATPSLSNLCERGLWYIKVQRNMHKRIILI